jgi:hypothetical protein
MLIVSMSTDSVVVFRCRLLTSCSSFEVFSASNAQPGDLLLHIRCIASLDSARARAAYFSFNVDLYRFSTA